MRLVVLAAVIGAACSPPPTAVPVTLTAPAPTPTVAPVDLAPAMEVGARFAYADGATLVAVPHGPFLMGHGSADNPEHTVSLSDYWIYFTPVTNHQYSICVSQGLCTDPDPDDNPDYKNFESGNSPVVGITYDQAQAYCSALNAALPTEAQWEKAARGNDGRLYPWGDATPSCELLNFDSCVKRTSDVTTHPAGASPYGALDMAGNVYEWVADWYDPIYYQTSPAGDPTGPADGGARVLRGSGFRSSLSEVVSYARSYTSPREHRPDLGFRCVVKNPQFFAPACALAGVLAPEDMTSVQESCPTISIDVQTTACRYGGGAVVTFNDSLPQDPYAAFGGIIGCTLVSGRPGSYPLTYRCMHGSAAVLSSSCTYSGITSAQCGPHYKFDPASGLCRWDATLTASIDCPSGEFYDPVNHCCLVSSGDAADYPVCPPGSLFTKTGQAAYSCFPAGSVGHVPALTESINPPVCPGLCDLTIESCATRNLVFCPNTCACLSVGVKCPTH